MYANKVVICGVDTSKLPLLKEAQKSVLNEYAYYYMTITV